MRRISTEEARKFISKDEDLLNRKAVYFTLTTSADGWEKVTYYTNKIKILNLRLDINKQYVYILSNPAMPRLIKIGYTKNHPGERVKQLSRSSSIPVPFDVEWVYPCYNAIELEGEVHKYLESYRVNDSREFFQIPIKKAKSIIKKLGKKYN